MSKVKGTPDTLWGHYLEDTPQQTIGNKTDNLPPISLPACQVPDVKPPFSTEPKLRTFPDSLSLFNSLGIADYTKLSHTEKRITDITLESARDYAAKLSLEELCTFEALREIHRIIFTPIYPQIAGKPRDLNTKRIGHTNVEFSDHRKITDDANTIFSDLLLHLPLLASPEPQPNNNYLSFSSPDLPSYGSYSTSSSLALSSSGETPDDPFFDEFDLLSPDEKSASAPDLHSWRNPFVPEAPPSPADRVTETLAGYYQQIYKVHPFREGNTRSIGVQFDSLFKRHGKQTSLSDIHSQKEKSNHNACIYHTMNSGSTSFLIWLQGHISTQTDGHKVFPSLYPPQSWESFVTEQGRDGIVSRHGLIPGEKIAGSFAARELEKRDNQRAVDRLGLF